MHVHYLDVDTETRWDRVQRRNAEKGPTYKIDVTREMFDFMNRIWQAPEIDEVAPYSGTFLVIDR